MKKFILSILMALVVACPALGQYVSDVIVTSSNGIWTDERAYDSLSDAITAVGANERTIVVASTETVTNLTVPSNITLKFIRGGNIANSGTLDIQTTNIEADAVQIFTGTGDIDFTNGTIVKTSWFDDFVDAVDQTNNDYITLLITEKATVDTDCALGDNVILKSESYGNRVSANAGFTFSNIKNIECPNFQLFAGSGDFDFLDGTELKLDWFNNLRALNNQVESEEVKVIVSGSAVIDYNETTTDNIVFDLTNGDFNISAGVTLTIYSIENIVSTFNDYTVVDNLTDLQNFPDSVISDFNTGAGTLTVTTDTTNKVSVTMWNGSPGDAIYTTGDYSTEETADTTNAIFAAKDGVATTTGVWIRLAYLDSKELRPEWFGSVDGTADDVQITAAADLAEDLTIKTNIRLSPIEYDITAATEIGENVNVIGTHIPEQDSPGAVPQIAGTILNRSADCAVFTMTGTNYTSDRVGHNLIKGIAFTADQDITSEAVIDATFADNVVIENCSIWDDPLSTTVGHGLDMDTCWDWKIFNVIWKYYGNTGGTKYAVNVYNGDVHSTNYIIFNECKWYSGRGIALYSDVSGGGLGYNQQVYFTHCKFEDNTDTAGIFISGTWSMVEIDSCFYSAGPDGFIDTGINHLYVHDSQMGGGETRMISIASSAQDVVIRNNYITATGTGPTEAINVDGARNVQITGNFFSAAGVNYTRFIHMDGSAGGNELKGCIIKNNRVYEAVEGTTPLIEYTGYTHPSMVIENNGSYQNETVTTGSPTLFRHSGYTYLDSSGGAITATQPDGIRPGDTRTIVMIDATTSSTVSVTHHSTDDPEVFTFADYDDTLVLIWNGSEYKTLMNDGVDTL